MNTILSQFDKKYSSYLINTVGFVLDTNRSKSGKTWLETYIESNNIHRNHVKIFYEYITNSLLGNVNNHDLDKVMGPKSYLYAFALRYNLSKNKITWDSIIAKSNIPMIQGQQITQSVIDKFIGDAVNIHRQTENHHAERFGTNQFLMSTLDIHEAVADWLAVALEIGSDPSVWFRTQCETGAFYFGKNTSMVTNLIHKGEKKLYELREQDNG